MPITQRGGVLIAGDATSQDYFGESAAVSADGLVLAVGALAGAPTGAVYIYDWNTGTSAWVQRGTKLVPADGIGGENFGTGVALSDDGAVLAVGARGGNDGPTGAVYIYDWNAGTSAWDQRGSKLDTPSLTANTEYGHAVALSGAGTILAVGERYRNSQGGVYVYDWNSGTSAWDLRGSMLVSSDIAISDQFGSGVALSTLGLVLAVGAPGWEGALSGQGGVYIYDWNAGTSAWDQRGSVLTAADAAASDAFGAAVALSEDGPVLFVGAMYHTGSLSSQGGAYLYDWNSGTSAWDQRGAVLLASDAAASDYFGSGVAISSDATVLVVGARSWEGVSTNQGAVYVYDTEGVLPTGTPVAETELTVIFLGTPTAPTALYVTATGTPTAPTALFVEFVGAPVAPTSLVVSAVSGTPTAPTALYVTATGTPTAPTLLAVISGTHEPIWTARCVIGGVDVSDQMSVSASVTAAEGAARLASVTLKPPSGVVAPLDYVGKTLTLDYVQVIGGVDVPRRLFTGLIDSPDYDPNTTLLALSCVDDLQNRVAALPRGIIDGLVSGRYAEAVQGEIDDNWDYAEAVLSTVAASLDAGPTGGMRVTPWQIEATWATWGEADLLYQRSRVTYPQRSTLINRVTIAYEYRYPRLRQRNTTVGWSGTQNSMVACGFQYPAQQDIAGAAGGSGWTITKAAYWPAPAAIPYGGKFVFPREGAIDMAVVWLSQRHSQTVTESYSITVTAPESIAENGTLPHALRGALSSEFDGQAWESAFDVQPLMDEGGEQDWAPDAPRASSDHAIQALLDQARTNILGSHRSARLANAVLCNPDLDLDKRVAINTGGMAAAGKVVSVTHVLDFAAGSAVSEFEIACFGIGGAGLITPDALDPPAPPESAAESQEWPSQTPNPGVCVHGQTPYQPGLNGLLINPPETITIETAPGEGTESVPNPFYTAGSYPVTGFRIAMPGVEDADRNPISKPASQTYQIVVPSDPLTFIVP